MVTKASFDTVSVFTTDQGRLCPDCGQPKGQCRCQKATPQQSGDGIIRVGRQTKGRKGSGVTTITGLSLPPDRLRDLAGRLKKRCGAGGAVKEGVIEIQGEHRDILVQALQQLGYTVKRVGG